MTPSTPSTPSAKMTPGTTLVRAQFPPNVGSDADSEQMAAATAVAVALWQQQHAQHMQSIQAQVHLPSQPAPAGLVPNTFSPPQLPPPPGLTPMTAAGVYSPPTPAITCYSPSPAPLRPPGYSPYLHHVQMMGAMPTPQQTQCQWPPQNPNEMGAAGMAYVAQTTAQQLYPPADQLSATGMQPQQQLHYYQQPPQLPPDPAVVQVTANTAPGPNSASTAGPLAFTGNPIYAANSTATDYASLTDPLSAFFTIQQRP